MAEIVEEERHSADELRFLRKRIVLIAMDGSKHSEYAFRCKNSFFTFSTFLLKPYPYTRSHVHVCNTRFTLMLIETAE